MTNQEAIIILNGIKGIGNAFIRRLVDYFGSPVKALKASGAELASAQIIPANAVQNIIQFSQDTFLLNEYNCARQKQVQIITYLEEAYPALLREIPDSPAVLYVKGDLKVLENPCVGLVGSREASIYGLTTAAQLSRELAEKGFTIVSGLARGIDTASHKGALQAKGKTVAVVGCGLNHVYPAQNKNLFEEIAQSGAVVSEFPFDCAPLAHNFPRRNRIISGLSLGIVVVEASEKSGALITADFALEQGREVFAVPGPIGCFSSTGVNNLIKQGAKLITSVDDVIEDLAEPFIKNLQEPSVISSQLSENENIQNEILNEEEYKVFEFLTSRAQHIDEISILSGMNQFKLSAVLLQLEMRGYIKQLPGKHYVKNTHKEKVYV